VGLGLYALWPTANTAVQVDPAAASSGWQQSGVANPFGSAAAEASASSPASLLATSVPPSLSNTSLAGTQPDGDWGLDARGQLRASRGLRQRFDYYLSLIGEKSLSEIEALLLHDAHTGLQEPARSQMLAVWRAYVQLQQHRWQHVVDLKAPLTWSAALTERQIMRRQLLGADWAHAFYAEEEAQLQAMLSQVNHPASAAARPPDAATAAMHPQATEREAAVHAQWQEWEQRLQTARLQIKLIQTAAELSQPQRQQAVERYLSQQFEGTELIRARALLGLPG
jgi:lipase chaperone LimK